MKKKITALALSLIMLMQLLPMPAAAVDIEIAEPECNMNCNTELVTAHQQTCAIKEYYREIYTAYTAQELYAMKDQLSTSAWEFIVSESWNLDNAKAQELNTLIQNGSAAEPERTTISKTVNGQTVTVSGELPVETEIIISAANTVITGDGLKKETDYDIALSLDGEEYEPDSKVKVTISGLDICEYSFAKLTHYMEDVEAIQAGYTAGTVQAWTDASIAANYPNAAAAALEALGMSDTVCVELFYSSAGEVSVSSGAISFYASTFSIYTLEYTGTDSATSRIYAVYNDDNGTAQNSNGYSEDHEITMDDSDNATFMLTRGQKFYLDIGPTFFLTGMTSYQWYLSSSNLGSLDTSGFGTLAGNDTILTVSSSAPHYTKYTIKVIGYNLWGTNRKERTINVYVVPEVQLIFNANIPSGATSSNITVPTSRKTVLGDGTSTVPYTRVQVSNPTGSVTGYSFDGWYTAAVGGTKVSSGSYVFLDNDNAEYIGGTYSDQYRENLYAHWTPITYTISYTLNNGSVSPDNPTTYNVETASFKLNNPGRNGYTFTGWTGTGLSSATKDVTIAKGSTGNRTYTANWAANTYYVSFTGNGATSGSMSNQTFTYDQAQALTANVFTRQYTVTYNANSGSVSPASATATAAFNGWATSANGAKVYNNQQSVSNLTVTPGGTVDLYANWTLGSVTLPTPTRAGHKFEGWYTDAALTKSAGSAGAAYTPTVDITLYAKWEPLATFAVTYEYTGTVPENAPSAPETKDYTVGDTVSVAADPTLGGYSFNGWTSTNPVVTASQNSFTMPASAVTLSGSWIVNSYTILYNSAGGSAVDSQTYNVTTDVTLAAAPTKDGYKFDGWALSTAVNTWDADTYGASENVGSGKYGNITLVAQWIPQYRYELAFDTNTTDTVTGMPGNMAVTGWLDSATYQYSWSGEPSRANYTFKGWSANKDAAAGDRISNCTMTGTPAATETVTLYAIWEENTVTIQYKVDGAGGTVSPGSQTVKVKTGMPSSTATASSNYNFLGWYDASGKQLSTQATFTPAQNNGVYEAAVYYARFQRKTGSLIINVAPADNDRPVIITVTGPDGVNMTFVTTASLTVPDLPTGNYTVTAESWGCDANVGVAVVDAAIEESDPAEFTVTVSTGSTGWFTAVAWVRNFFGMNDGKG